MVRLSSTPEKHSSGGRGESESGFYGVVDVLDRSVHDCNVSKFERPLGR